MRHQVCTVAFHLLVRRYSTENNFRKCATVEWAVGDSSVNHCQCPDTKTHHSLYLPNNLQWVLHNRNRKVGSIVDEPGDIVFGHFGELLLEDTL